MTFEQLNIIKPILEAVSKMGYITPSPIQEVSIPVLLSGKDLLASAQTGTGKTAAFAIPIIQQISGFDRRIYQKQHIHALILAPTRELAEQIKDNFRYYSENLSLNTEVIYGGVSQKNQEKALNRGVEVLIATPGRLLDLMDQGLITLQHVKYFVLDEADRMLDMGFIRDVRKIVTYIPKTRQTALFSATMPKEIIKLAEELLTEPVRVEITPPEAMVEKIDQKLFHVSKKNKTNLLLDLMKNKNMQSILVFTRTKHGANKLVKELTSYGVKLSAIHGNKSQNQRLQALNDFKNGKIRVLVATDIAARGIDIDELSHVVNYDLPETPETYVHRMGRTGRRGLTGEAYTFCSPDEIKLLDAIEKHIKMPIEVMDNHDYHIVKGVAQESKPLPRNTEEKGHGSKGGFRNHNKPKESRFEKPYKRENASSTGQSKESSVISKKSKDERNYSFSKKSKPQKSTQKYSKREESISQVYFKRKKSH
ncbi:ATP-dependent RNA helicase RhlE [Acholeplasma morum]|uniref:DEAD/DEAH box helicase n=1 Tax=Paracholeplasma morum TaxID=264637 RepID=UPI00195D9622|nr:DEAD/DEAH box helicase [Paracholeplasma morum]MBM7453206.1 ATP-dependent RNA helicase RhlE [Paracholeplasma morum]